MKVKLLAMQCMRGDTQTDMDVYVGSNHLAHTMGVQYSTVGLHTLDVSKLDFPELFIRSNT